VICYEQQQNLAWIGMLARIYKAAIDLAANRDLARAVSQPLAASVGQFRAERG
jgi:hypothetical protein